MKLIKSQQSSFNGNDIIGVQRCYVANKVRTVGAMSGLENHIHCFIILYTL